MRFTRIRMSIAIAFALTFTLSTVPTQALPLMESGIQVETSWIHETLGWLQGLWDGGEQEAGEPQALSTSGSCIDPMGSPGPCPR